MSEHENNLHKIGNSYLILVTLAKDQALQRNAGKQKIHYRLAKAIHIYHTDELLSVRD